MGAFALFCAFFILVKEWYIRSESIRIKEVIMFNIQKFFLWVGILSFTVHSTLGAMAQPVPGQSATDLSATEQLATEQSTTDLSVPEQSETGSTSWKEKLCSRQSITIMGAATVLGVTWLTWNEERRENLKKKWRNTVTYVNESRPAKVGLALLLGGGLTWLGYKMLYTPPVPEEQPVDQGQIAESSVTSHEVNAQETAAALAQEDTDESQQKKLPDWLQRFILLLKELDPGLDDESATQKWTPLIELLQKDRPALLKDEAFVSRLDDKQKQTLLAIVQEATDKFIHFGIVMFTPEQQDLEELWTKDHRGTLKQFLNDEKYSNRLDEKQRQFCEQCMQYINVNNSAEEQFARSIGEPQA